MPDSPFAKVHEHPAKRSPHDHVDVPHAVPAGTPGIAAGVIPCAELNAISNFSFLRGASHPDELVQHAVALGYAAIAIADVNSMAGIVRAHVAAKEQAKESPSRTARFIVGCRIELRDSGPILVYPTDRASYGRLCRLLTLGKRRAEKGSCNFSLEDLLAFHEGLLAVALPPGAVPNSSHSLRDFEVTLEALAPVFDHDRLSVGVARLFGADDEETLESLEALSYEWGIPLVAASPVHYHHPIRRPLHDVLCCIRNGTTIEAAGDLLLPHSEFHLKGPEEVARLFARMPRVVARSMEVARRAEAFSLDKVRYEYPEEVCPAGRSPMEYLRELTWEGATERFATPLGERKLFEVVNVPALDANPEETRSATVNTEHVPASVRERLEHEFALIEELGYAKYFLTVYDIVRFACSKGILCQGRGAAANSVVCYCLGITAVDPTRVELLFERFVSKERNEPPDIDIDFEHERREEVIQYIYNRFGRERAALVAEVISYRGRSAIRDVGKAMGLSLDLVDRLAKQLDWWDSGEVNAERLTALGIDPSDPTIRRVLALCSQIAGFPRHLSQHVGGFVIAQGRLDEMVPVENAAMEDRTVIEWDKDDIDAMGFLKVDCLGLGMLTCIRKTLDLVNASTGSNLKVHTIPPEDPAVYDMLCHADTVGVFQVESRAQMSMLPRLKPRCYYDLVIEVAIVRPGPIQGDMVHPYLRRRDKIEKFEFPTAEIKQVLGRTFGVPLFQEQAMKLAIVAAGFTAGEADELRRAMAAWKRKGKIIQRFGERIVEGMVAKGYTRDFGERCFDQIKGFGEYGFPESHAASFALLVYVSSWLKLYYPAAFAAALINSQPMGFYAPAQIVRDAQDHGVEALPVDVNHSGWDCSLETPGQIRLGMRLVKGLREEYARAIEGAVREHGPFNTVAALHQACRVAVAALRALASADAFGTMGLCRREAIWQIRELRDEALPLYESCRTGGEGLAVALPRATPVKEVSQDYASVGLSLKAHPVSFVRPKLTAAGVMQNASLRDVGRTPAKKLVRIAGLVLLRQRPGTASGVVFMTIEDETATANLILWPKVYERFRTAARHSTAVVVDGTVEREGEVVHVVVTRVRSIAEVAALDEGVHVGSRDFH